MHIKEHELENEFPEYRERIHSLNTNNPRFAIQLQDYSELDRQIVRIENGAEATSDNYLEALKKQRLKLKDKLYAMLLNGH